MSEFEGSKVYYFSNITDNPICGRGEPLKLLLDDAGVKFEYIKLTFSEWPSVKQKLIENGCRMPTLPYLVTKSGKFYGSTAPLLRLISKKLNKYIPKDTEDEYLADAYSDLYLDWMNKWMEVLVRKDPKITNDYETTYRDNQQTNWENILGDKSGPYILGEEISYTDFLLYHQLNNDIDTKVDASKYPRLAEFVKTIQNRPTLKKHFENEKKEKNEI